MRSGTTRLHRLLAADERFAHLRMFETMCPVPRPTRVNGHDRRPWVAALSWGLLHRPNTATANVHPTGQMEPGAEPGALGDSAWGVTHEALWRVRPPQRGCEGQGAAPATVHYNRKPTA